MNYLLRIVEGPNKGAEIALVEGVAVTFGKGDDCDIMLADVTVPDAPLNIESTPAGVIVDGVALEPLHVKTVGATSFAVGPADESWGELVWPKPEKEASGEDEENQGDAEEQEGGSPKDSSPAPEEQPSSTEKSAKKRRGCLGCLFVLLLLLLLAGVWGWFFRDRVIGFGEELRTRFFGEPGKSSETVSPGESAPKESSLAAIAARYGLSLSERDGGTVLSGNLRNRRERLAATAEAYQAQPGVNLDISDDETFRTTADDALFTLTEGSLKVVSATNRVLAITGTAPSATALKRTLEALNADMPKLRNVDVGGVKFADIPGQEEASRLDSKAAVPKPSRPASNRKAAAPSGVDLPVCGILTTPYPCLVMRDGRRILEGSAIGENVILRIEADSITMTNSTGRFVWKP